MPRPGVFTEDEVPRAHLAAIVESSDDAIISKDLDGIIRSWNGGAERLYGYSPEEAIGRSISMLVPDDYPDEISAIMERIRRGERVDHYQTVRQAKDGKRLTVSLTVSPMMDENGRIMGASAVARDITSATESEQTLRRVLDEAQRQQRLYETIISSTPDLVYVFDLNHRFIYANAALLEMWGRSWDEAIGKNLLEIGYEPWHAEMHEREIEQVIATKQPIRGEVPFPHHRLGRRIYDYIFVPILGPNGEVEAIGGTTRDVTEYRQMVEALGRSQEQRRVALESARMGTWDYDVTSGQLHWDQRTAGFFGLEQRESVPLEEAVARIHAEDRAQVQRQIDAAIDPSGDGRYDIEYRVIPDDGEQRWIRAVGQCLFEGEGGNRRAARFVGVVFDTTEARAVRDALHEANERAERNLMQLEAVVGQMAEGLIIADPQGNVLSMNDAALAMHELSSREEVNHPLRQYEQAFAVFEVETGEPLPLNDWPLARALRGETFTGQEVRVCNRRTGRTWIGLYGGTPIHAPQGDVQLVIATVRDITERKQAEQQLRELNETLEQRVADRTAEARRRADQLQKLAGEITEVEQRERRRLAQLLHDDLQQILVAAKMRLSAIRHGGAEAVDEAEQLLAEAINTSRSLSTELAPAVLYDVGLNAAMEWLARWAREKYNLRVEVESDDSEPAESEPLRALVFEAMRELLLNVVKHANVDEARIRVQRSAEQLQLTVEDFGEGFDPMARRAEHAPSGYGLFSLQERLELVDGQVRIDSAPGQGTRVEIMVPLVPSPHSPQQKPSGAPGAPIRDTQASEAVEATASEAEPSTRVLLVDDHDVVRRGLVNLIEQESDMRVVAQAGSGEEAVERARQHQPDVVVMDISLPGISGIDATRRILDESPQTCVIGLSVHEEQDVGEELRSAGARAYFNKGRAAEDLVQAVRRLVSAGGQERVSEKVKTS